MRFVCERAYVVEFLWYFSFFDWYRNSKPSYHEESWKKAPKPSRPLENGVTSTPPIAATPWTTTCSISKKSRRFKSRSRPVFCYSRIRRFDVCIDVDVITVARTQNEKKWFDSFFSNRCWRMVSHGSRIRNCVIEPVSRAALRVLRRI